MGGYILFSNKYKHRMNDIENIFRKKKMVIKTLFHTPDHTIIYYAKINHPQIQQYYCQNEDFIVGVGTFFFNKSFGKDALYEIYKELKENQADFEIFNQIMGHFNLILYLNGNLHIITDKTGCYHSFIHHEDEDSVIISTSFLSIVELLPEITLNKQSIMEFTMLSTFLCGDTIIDQIKLLDFGVVLTISPKKVDKNKYFVQKKWKIPFSYESIASKINEYFQLLNHPSLTTSIELSGGFDTRLVYAISKKNLAQYSLSSNINLRDRSDMKIAKKIAKGENETIQLIDKKMEFSDYISLLDNAYYICELMRPCIGAEYSSHYFDKKSKHANLIIGGYGGELYRDLKFRNISTFEQLFQNQYIELDIFKLYSIEERQLYFETLERKMRDYLHIKSDTLTKEILEEIYFHIKMMFWGGSRITFFNQYAFRLHPLLDYELIYPIFEVPESEKINAKFQMKMIEHYSPRIASYMSSYKKNFIWEEQIEQDPSLIVKLIRRYINAINRRVDNLFAVTKKERQWKQYLEKPVQFLKFFDIDESIFHKVVPMCKKIYSVERFLQINANKIISLS